MLQPAPCDRATQHLPCHQPHPQAEAPSAHDPHTHAPRHATAGNMSSKQRNQPPAQHHASHQREPSKPVDTWQALRDFVEQGTQPGQQQQQDAHHEPPAHGHRESATTATSRTTGASPAGVPGAPGGGLPAPANPKAPLEKTASGQIAPAAAQHSRPSASGQLGRPSASGQLVRVGTGGLDPQAGTPKSRASAPGLERSLTRARSMERHLVESASLKVVRQLTMKENMEARMQVQPHARRHQAISMFLFQLL
jgi:hypothetical protein